MLGNSVTGEVTSEGTVVAIKVGGMNFSQKIAAAKL